jgi:hypothetical protein
MGSISFPATTIYKPSGIYIRYPKIHGVEYVGDSQLLLWLPLLALVLTIIHATRVCNADSGVILEGCFWYTDRSPEASQDPMLSIKINNKYHFSTKMEYVIALSYISVPVEI